MALKPNLTSGKAVADVEALYFLKHTSETGGEPEMLNSLDSDAWFPVLSSKGTVNAGQDAPSIDKILVDQFDAPIGITSEPGDFTFEALLPSFKKNAIAAWLGDDLHETSKTIEGKSVLGLNLTGKTYDMSVMIITKTGATILFSHAQVAYSFTKEDKVFMFRVSGQILAPSNPKNDTMYIATETAAEISADEQD